ncbi:MAG: flavin reductase family protein [Thermoleophilia bacterium]
MSRDAPDTLSRSFRDAMGQLASGVVMVTCHVDGRPWGLTVSACCSVSLEPPLLLVSLAERTVSAVAIGEHGRFGVSVLGERGVEVARLGSAPGQPKFVDGHVLDPGSPVRSATPVVAHALAHVDCAVERRVPAGDHVIYLGRVLDVHRQPGDRPLVYYARSYHGLGEAAPAP